MTPHNALQKLCRWMPYNYDVEPIPKFIRTIEIYPIGSIIELLTEHIGIVVKLNESHRLKPVVMVIMDREKNIIQEGSLSILQVQYGTKRKANQK